MNAIEKKTTYKKILLIDDDEVDLFITERIVKAANYADEVVSKRSAYAAFEYLQGLMADPKSLPQVIFLDINMPGDNGIDFLNKLYSLDPKVIKNCKVIVLSNLTDPSLKEIKSAAAHPMVKNILHKPLTVAMLDSMLN